MPNDEACASKVEDIVKGAKDPAGERILKVYSYNPPLYAIYRTRDRMIVHYADPDQEPLRSQQRSRIVPLMPMRGQINGLINGWRSANDDGTVDGEATGRSHNAGSDDKPDASPPGFFSGPLDWRRTRAKREQFRKVYRYDRRVADAIITVLEDGNNLELAQELLAQVKNDLIAERTAIARGQYVDRAFLLVIGMVGLTTLLTAGAFDSIHRFPPELGPVWTAVSGGTVGAFFSIVTGLKSRDVVIDLQNRENRIDVTLRMVIGAISGAVLYSLFATDLVSTAVFDNQAIVHGPTEGSYNGLTVFLIGFVAGFFERLVPNLLSKTNFGTAEPAGKDTPVQVVPTPGANGPAETAATDATVVDQPDPVEAATAAVSDSPDITIGTEEPPRPAGA
ncbi:hypothetical protein [Sphingomonas psychrotolerans]|uniref:Uncharacterized protein n=1 Tax=Sphingomonas psychrotolerans TaxID=1327635 RepID=A0A2K8MRN9_9SPHN|nr:hypothetical protein [Sphingomonas psychrotolerans]ATY34131.1 hypothetical protein CVN68_21015 [Sphingomonas psychrotolerans]